VQGARLLENENHIFFVRYIAAGAFLVLRDWRSGETLKSETYECGSPPAPRKASTWNGNQPLLSSNKAFGYNPLEKTKNKKRLCAE
jgi:hypothetical protein